jgi:hypothetical protein
MADKYSLPQDHIVEFDYDMSISTFEYDNYNNYNNHLFNYNDNYNNNQYNNYKKNILCDIDKLIRIYIFIMFLFLIIINIFTHIQ